MLKSKRLWIGIALSLALLAFFVRGIHWGEVGAALAEARWAWILPGTLLYAASYWGRARRITQILGPLRPVPSARALPPLLIGFMFNNILPGRLGEFVFAFLLGKREGIPRSSALAAVLLSRILDGITILAFFLAGLLLLPAQTGTGEKILHVAGLQVSRGDLMAKIAVAGYTGSAIFGAALVACMGLVLWRSATLAVFGRVLSLFPPRLGAKALGMLEGFVGGLGILHEPGALAKVALLNFVPWTLELGTYFLVAQAFGLELGWGQCSLVMGMTNLAMLLPSAPGGIGLFQVGGMMALVLWPLPPAACLAYLLVLHAVILVPVNVAGAYFLWQEGISFQSTLDAVVETA